MPEPGAREDTHKPVGAQSPGDLPKRSWRDIAKRVATQFKKDELTDRAAALTYYGILSIFPGLLVLVSVIGLLGPSATKTLLDNIAQMTPGSVEKTIRTIIENAQSQQTAAGVAGVVGLLAAFWSASGYVAAFMRSSNAIYQMPEGRPIWKTAPIRLFVTLVTVVGLVAGLLIVVATGSLADRVGRVLGASSTLVSVWNIAKWPVLLVLFAVMLALLYWASPNVRSGGFRWLSPGAGLAVVIWLIASGGFAVYVANFASYNKTYGALAGVIVFLVWLWISNIAILLGVELDAELEHERALRAGVPEHVETFAIPRDTRNLDDDEKAEAEQVTSIRAGHGDPQGRSSVADRS